MKRTGVATIAMALVAVSLYILMSFIATSSESFPFLIGVAFLGAVTLSVVLGATSFSVWTVRYAQKAGSRGGLAGAWVVTAATVAGAATILFQMFRGGPFWSTLFGDLLWAVTITTGLFWLGFILLIFFTRRI